MSSQKILIFFIIATIFEFIMVLILNLLNLNQVKKNTVIPDRYKDKLTEDTFSKSRKYTIAKLKFTFLYEGYDLLLLLGFIFINGFCYLENLVLRITNIETVQAVLFCFTLSFAKEILDLPFSLYQTFVMEEKYGFNKMTIGLYFLDLFKKIVLTVIFGAPILMFLFWVIRAAGSLWWLYGFIGVSVFQIMILVIYPTWIAPLFNKFIPMEKGELKDAIFKIAQDVNFKISEIFVMDGSKRSSHSNAYFTGLGKNRRIVLFDTLINQLSKDELVSVLAHEMGHNKLKHIQKMLILSLLLMLIFFYGLSLLLFYPNLYQAFGLSGQNIFPALVIFSLIISPLSFFISPLLNILSRKHEYEADHFASKASNTGKYLQSALLKLNEKNLSNLTPHPLYSFFYYSHPTLEERLNALEKY